MKAVVLDLLRRYLNVEHHFQQGKRHHYQLVLVTGSGRGKGRREVPQALGRIREEP